MYTITGENETERFPRPSPTHNFWRRLTKTQAKRSINSSRLKSLSTVWRRDLVSVVTCPRSHSHRRSSSFGEWVIPRISDYTMPVRITHPRRGRRRVYRVLVCNVDTAAAAAAGVFLSVIRNVSIYRVLIRQRQPATGCRARFSQHPTSAQSQTGDNPLYRSQCWG